MTAGDDGAAAFIRAHTAVAAPPLCPEIRLHLATEITPIWQATEETLAAAGLPPPFWAFCWAGGQALARHLLDNPALAAGRRVLDFACGGGVVAIAAARCGGTVLANDVDPFALAATRLNADLNGVALATEGADLVGRADLNHDLILAGDICYEQPLAGRVSDWLRALAGAGATVLIGDPGRAYLRRDGLVELAAYDVPTSLELEDRTVRRTGVWRVTP
ncbi:MAG: methyltransferase [Hyphomicrobiales bacterium]|nr:methyltransferase [Hyphomicrobiales bacterium]